MSGERRGLKLSNINTNSAVEIVCVKEIRVRSLHTNLFKALVLSPSNDNTATSFPARIVDVRLFQVIINHCSCKLNRIDVCQ